MSSGKKNSKRVAPRPSKSKNVGEDDEVLITPKEEFIPHSVDPEEAERYWVVVCNKITLPLETPFPRRLRFPVNPNSPSRIVPDTLTPFANSAMFQTRSNSASRSPESAQKIPRKAYSRVMRCFCVAVYGFRSRRS
ncbi:hypothetical protein Bca4012_051338 [Brassica carinata]